MFCSSLPIILLLLCCHSLESHPLSFTKPLANRGNPNVNVGPHWNRLGKRTYSPGPASELEEVCTNVDLGLVSEKTQYQKEDGTNVKPILKIKREDSGATMNAESNQPAVIVDEKKVKWGENITHVIARDLLYPGPKNKEDEKNSCTDRLLELRKIFSKGEPERISQSSSIEQSLPTSFTLVVSEDLKTIYYKAIPKLIPMKSSSKWSHLWYSFRFFKRRDSHKKDK
ncbi:hypothetical protein PCANC_22633 [Puccinia coronata f. sp. avenae]|uniref:Uncharacterized protein n=1 Tax=Puccinia coronata f. sp. avenae TaxID=200324 RepID=A0A2N5TLM1_9BASI|nr:hypothetical protein PCASD_09246 [Puccinia coronata f. sp. avenae]PLW26288.1 hypothetical protein PCANC_22633 [Puccinia coronata f. sp. avenae]